MKKEDPLRTLKVAFATIMAIVWLVMVIVGVWFW